MIIALDFDGTYSADPVLWDAFIKLAMERGHSVTCVTKREPELATGLFIPTIYTSRHAKLPFMPAGTIWIDDNPDGIYMDDDQTMTLARK